MNFSPETALAYARAIARPRLVGSGEEEKVAQELAARLHRFGYNVEREPFQFTRAFDIVLTYEVAFALLLILLAIVFPHTASIFGIFLLGLLAIVQPLNRVIHHHAVASDIDSRDAAPPLTAFCLRLGRLRRASNIVARLPDPLRADLGVCPALYLVSHFDSKSQRMPVFVRIALFMIAVPGAILFAALTFAQSLREAPNLQPLSTLVGLLTILCGIPLLFLDVGNESPGAIDNAAGTGLVLHLAECLRSRPDLSGKLRITILITSAEEMAAMGALYHVKRNLNLLKRDARSGGLYVLNFDGTGVDGQLYVAFPHLPSPAQAPRAERGARGRGVGGEGEQLINLLHRAAADLAIPLHRFTLTGALFDHIPFTEHGFDAASLMTIGDATRAVHTPQDTVDKLHPRGFELAGRVAMRVIELLAS